jgi:Excalibur calcium-binding domain
VRVTGIIIATAVAKTIWLVPSPAAATSGGFDAAGCHNDRKYGTGYHCHRTPSRGPISSRRVQDMLADVPRAYPSCSAARAAGAAPLKRGDPGYGLHLDRDNDGTACE